MAAFTPCPGSGKQAVSLVRYPSVRDGLGMTRASTYGNCPDCGRLQRVHGLAQSIKVTRHKASQAQS